MQRGALPEADRHADGSLAGPGTLDASPARPPVSLDGFCGYFTENPAHGLAGWGDYSARGSDLTVSFEQDSMNFLLVGTGPDAPDGLVPFSMRFLGGRPVAPIGRCQLGHTTSLFLGNDPARWVSGARDFAEVWYDSVYAGIDVVFRMRDGMLKYDFIVRPGTDPSVVRLQYDGVEALGIDPSCGDLLIDVGGRTLRDSAPFAYQQARTGRTEVPSSYDLSGPGQVSFDLGAYDPASPLVIDPGLNFSTFVGGSNADLDYGTFFDDDGSIYLTGYTMSSSFPVTSGVLDGSFNGAKDAFIIKLSADGSSLLYSTFVGGTSNDWGYGIFVDGSGSVYATGETWSTGFPTTAGAFDTTYNQGGDVFVLKLNASGNKLDYSTFIGSTAEERGYKIQVDDVGCAYVSGVAWGAFPTTVGAFQRNFMGGAHDAFVLKLNASGDKLLYSTIVGTNDADAAGGGMWVDAFGHAYLLGWTASGAFPVKSGCYDVSFNGVRDLFLIELKADGSTYLASTYVGGSSEEEAYGLAADASGDLYVTGRTLSNDFPTTSGAYDRSYAGGQDSMVFKVDGALTTLEYSTFLGGTGRDMGLGVWADAQGSTFVTGETESTDFPTTSDAISGNNAGGTDLYITELDPSGSTVLYSTFLGGSGVDRGMNLKVDGGGGIVVSGWSDSSDFPSTSGVYDESPNGGYDVIVLRITLGKPPRWGTLPSLTATEDVPRTIDFTGYINDPDSPLTDLVITSSSQFVKAIAGHRVTFQFPNGVLGANVPLVLTDGYFAAVGDVNFTVTPVNDPPSCSIPTQQAAVEDVPLTINFTPYVNDIDNITSDLFVMVSDIYTIARGLELTVTFPEGVLSYNLSLNLSDGLNMTAVRLHFTITPVDDPPVVGALPMFTAIEDRDSVFNITPYLSDIDTPIPQVRVMVRDANCTVAGQLLHFIFKRGNVDTNVSLEVTDAHNRVPVVLRVHVVEVNDPPIVHGVSPKLFTEDQPRTVDLSAYIEDEDTPRDHLVLECSDPHAVLPIVGFYLTLLYTTWSPEQTVSFSVFDGVARTNGSFDVQVLAVNDLPVILGLGDLALPVTLTIDEGTERYYQVRLSDEDSTTFKYTLESQWSGITAFQNGTVRVSAAQGDIGNYTAILTVNDLNGGNASIPISITVRNVNDPPTVPMLVLPQNHTIVEEGTNVTFSVDVLDPDTAMGQVLTVTWVSNVSGIIRSLTSNHTLMFITDRLPVGVHRITVTVTDGQYVREAWLELTITAKYVPPPPKPEEPSFLTGTTGIAAIAIIVVLVIVGILLVIVMGRRRDAEEEMEERASAAPSTAPPPEPAMVPITMEGDLAALGRSLGDMATQLEATRAAEAKSAAALPAGPAPVLEAVPVLVSEADEADREHTREVREVMRALTQLPQGLPTSLWGWDMSELARAVVDGEKRTAPDGTALVKLKGKWYNADRTNVGVFVREWKQPEAPAAPARAATTAEKRDLKLEQLETALLEGKISEQMYRELKRKYEGGG
jgi:hypothetical protein